MNFFRRTLNNTRQKKLYNLIPYVLIGGGTASYYASMTIRARDPDAKVLIITGEEESPYRRAPLSKELWWYGDEQSASTLSYKSPTTEKRKHLLYEADGFYLDSEKLDNWEHGGIALMCGVKVGKIDSENNFIQLQDGRKIDYGKCLIATGSLPLHKNLLQSDTELSKYVSTLGDIKDYRELHKRIMELERLATENPSTSGQCKNIVILGGGLLGTELAYSLNRRFVRDKKDPKIKIVQIASVEGILSEILPRSLCHYSTKVLNTQGIEIHSNTNIDAITLRRKEGFAQLQLKLSKNGHDGTEEVLCDHLILADGTEPAIELIQNSHLPMDKKNGGVIADALFGVKPNLWAAGDICSFFDETLGYRRRCTHWQHAQITGRIAGENMTLGHKAYIHQGAFVTMLGHNAHICGIGDTDPKKLNTTTIYAQNENRPKPNDEEETRAIVFYTHPNTNQICGVLLYNVYGFAEEMARKLIQDKEPMKKSIKEYAKLFELWEIDPVEEERNEVSSDLSEKEIEAYQNRED